MPKTENPKIKPAYVEDNPIMEGAYAAFLEWAWSQDDAHRAFQSETGTAPLRPARTPMDAAIDKATGYVDAYMRGFVDWATRNYWGVEGDPRLDEAEGHP